MFETESASHRGGRTRAPTAKTLSAPLLPSNSRLPQDDASAKAKLRVSKRQASMNRPSSPSPLSQVSYASSSGGNDLEGGGTKDSAQAVPLTNEEVALQPFLEKGPKLLFILLDNKDARQFYYAVPDKDRVTVYPASYKQSIVKWSCSIREYTTINPFVNHVVRVRGNAGVVPDPIEKGQETQWQSDSDIDDVEGSGEDRHGYEGETSAPTGEEDAHYTPTIIKEEPAEKGAHHASAVIKCETDMREIDASRHKLTLPTMDESLSGVEASISEREDPSPVVLDQGPSPAVHLRRSVVATFPKLSIVVLSATSAILGGVVVWVFLASTHDVTEIGFSFKLAWIPVKLGLLWALSIAARYTLRLIRGIALGIRSLALRMRRSIAQVLRFTIELAIIALDRLHDQVIDLSKAEPQ